MSHQGQASLNLIRVGSPTLHVLAAGKTPQDVNNARGHLFEQFVAKLLHCYGYENPTVDNLTVTASGIELDVSTKHRLTRQHGVAECKAYTTNLPAKALTAFYGKLAGFRFTHDAVFGWFVALPGLTPEGDEQAELYKRNDAHFDVLTSNDVDRLLGELHLLSEPPCDGLLRSDLAVIITEHGIYSAAKVIDPDSRLAQYVQIWSCQGGVPVPVTELVEASDYASGLSVRRISDTTEPPKVAGLASGMSIVPVTGGKSDFEYQFPASPAFFVGRKLMVNEFKSLLVASQNGSQLVVLNGQSGWGKSSLALRIKELVMQERGHGVILDTRTASSPEYVWQAIRFFALECEQRGILKLPSTTSFAGLQSSVATLRDAAWSDQRRTALLFFDQFENVFRDPRLTQEFRDLALSATGMPHPLIVGFAWKTDVAGWTENYPFQLRDDIRANSRVLLMEPFGPHDISTLLDRLEKPIGAQLSRELRLRLREYSQGLPWLFKKLANHILQELSSGATQDQLVARSLNVKGLFENDLAELGPQEQEALRKLAKLAPLVASDALEIVRSEILESLVHRRLVVQVGQSLDIYWDIFRDFLNTGDVPIQDTYILRQTPNSAASVLRAAIDAGGDIGTLDLAAQLDTTEGVVFNIARDLRQMGVLVDAPGRVRVAEDIVGVPSIENVEDAVRVRVSASLHRHRALSILRELINKTDGEANVTEFASSLPQAYPAVDASEKTWLTYARAFLHWFSYAGLVSFSHDKIRLGALDPTLSILSPRKQRTNRRAAFPQSPPGPALESLRSLTGHRVGKRPSEGAAAKGRADLFALGLATVDDGKAVASEPAVIQEDGSINRPLLLSLLQRVPGGTAAIEAVERGASTHEIGGYLRDGQRTDWSDGTTGLSGKYFRAWAREAGIGYPRMRGALKMLGGAG